MDCGRWHIVEVTPAVTALARRQLTRYDLRSGEAIQLASALWLRQVLGDSLTGMAAFDTRVVSAAVAEQFSLPLDRLRARR